MIALLAAYFGLHAVAKKIKHQPVEFVDWLVHKCFWLVVSLLAGVVICWLVV